MASLQSLLIFPENCVKQLPIENVRNIAKRIYRGEKIPSRRLTNLVCCSDYRIRRLNRVYRNKDKVTDVLSFPFDDADFLGEIYLSIRRVEVQARKFGHSFEDEFCRLVVHGLLHLCGYDHHTSEDQVLMNKKENHYLQKKVY